MDIGGGRPRRFCPVCRLTDDHPRHERFETVEGLHFDCCRESGCPTGSCDVTGEVVGNELRGAELLDAIMANAGKIAELIALRSAPDTRGTAEILAEPNAQRIVLHPDQLGGT